MYSWISIFARTSCSFFFVTLWHCSFRIGFRSKVSIRLKFRFRYRRMWMLDINICQSENWRDQCKLTKTQLLFTLSDHYIKQYIQNQHSILVISLLLVLLLFQKDGRTQSSNCFLTLYFDNTSVSTEVQQSDIVLFIYRTPDVQYILSQQCSTNICSTCSNNIWCLLRQVKRIIYE